jgi:hypothetical protein
MHERQRAMSESGTSSASGTLPPDASDDRIARLSAVSCKIARLGRATGRKSSNVLSSSYCGITETA